MLFEEATGWEDDVAAGEDCVIFKDACLEDSIKGVVVDDSEVVVVVVIVVASGVSWTVLRLLLLLVVVSRVVDSEVMTPLCSYWRILLLLSLSLSLSLWMVGRLVAKKWYLVE